MAISKNKRLRIFKRDFFRCVQCGMDEDLTLDHIIPKSAGGSDIEENLQIMCRWCNNRKGGIPYGNQQPDLNNDCMRGGPDWY